jgi:hypothetical protein
LHAEQDENLEACGSSGIFQFPKLTSFEFIAPDPEPSKEK